MNQAINLTMAAVFVILGSGLGLALLEPKIMRALCGRGLAWAACVEAFKINRPQEVKYWDRTLGVVERAEELGVE